MSTDNVQGYIFSYTRANTNARNGVETTRIIALARNPAEAVLAVASINQAAANQPYDYSPEITEQAKLLGLNVGEAQQLD